MEFMLTICIAVVLKSGRSRETRRLWKDTRLVEVNETGRNKGYLKGSAESGENGYSYYGYVNILILD
jgi:hypothetical protein